MSCGRFSFRGVSHPSTSANQNVTNNFLRENPVLSQLEIAQTCLRQQIFPNLARVVTGTEIDQLVERPIEKTGAILMRVRVQVAAWDFSPRVSFQCRLSYSVHTAPVCNRMHRSTSVRTLKIPNTVSHIIVWTHEILHTLVGLGSAALAAAVPYPAKATRISHYGQRSTKT